MENINFTQLTDMSSKYKDIRYSGLINTILLQNGKKPIDAGLEDINYIATIVNTIEEFMYDTYKGLLDWIATTEIVVEKAIYKTRQNNIRLLKDFIDSKNKYSSINFLEVKDLKVPVLLGLKVDLHTVNKELANTSYVKRVIDEIQYANELFNLLKSNNGITVDKLGNKTIDIDELENRCKLLEKDISNIKKTIKKIIDEKSVKDVKPLKEVVRNMSDLIKSSEDTLKLGVMYSVEKIEAIDRYYEDLVSNIDETLELMNVKKDTKLKHDKDTIIVLSTYIRDLADLISMVSMLFFLYSTTVDMEIGIFKILDAYIEKRSPSNIKQIVELTIDGIKSTINDIGNLFKF